MCGIFRLFGFSDHYTVVAYLGQFGCQRLSGKVWSISSFNACYIILQRYLYVTNLIPFKFAC